MALRAVPDHPKFASLKAALKLPKGAALGWLESMWHFTGRFTPCGDIGKYTDAQIEAWLEWDGEPGALMKAFVDTQWIDCSKEYRLVVHDWHLHADNATKLAVKRAGRSFCGHTVESSSTRRRLPEPVPVPVPEPEPEPGAGEPTVEDIILAHPTPKARGMTALALPTSWCAACVDSLAAGETRLGLLAKVEAIAQVVQGWPPGEMKFLKSVDRFFRESEFNKPLAEWRANGTDRVSDIADGNAANAQKALADLRRGGDQPPEFPSRRAAS